MLKKVHIIKATLYDKKKDGSELTYTDKRTGELKRYKSVGLKIDGEPKTVYLSVFDKKQEDMVMGWKPEDEVELEITQNGEFTNASLPRKNAGLEEAVKDLIRRVKALEDYTAINSR